MKNILTYILIFLTFSCIDKKEETKSKKTQVGQIETTNPDVENLNELKSEKNIKTQKSNRVFIDSTNFKYFDLKEFDLRGWDYGKITNELKSFYSKEKLIEYFQNDRFNSENIYPVNYHFFSIQKNEANEKIITLLEGDESCCNDLHYLIYNSENELISDNIVAGTGGDGMWSYNQYGKFINDSTYVLTRVDLEEVELENGGSELQIDSVITNYRFYKSKPFNKLSEHKFKKVEKN